MSKWILYSRFFVYLHINFFYKKLKYNMRLNGRRTSDNVQDGRARKAIGGKGLGIGGIIIVGLIVWLSGGDLSQVFNVIQQTQQQNISQTSEDENFQSTPKEEELKKFVSIIFAGTEDAWTDIFSDMGSVYRKPKMHIFRTSVTSGCGNASSSTGPFYCPADETVYIDLSFFDEMEGQLHAGGDFAYAYVIAHEVGHHVQKLLGILDKERAAEAANPNRKNELSVRTELQADFFAGVWAHHDNKNYNSLEDGDIEEGLNVAAAIGDDRLQMEAQGYTVPESFNHGTSAQRSKWLKLGYKTGSLKYMDTFSPDYSDL